MSIAMHDGQTSAPPMMSWRRTIWMYLSPGVPVLALYVVGGWWLQRHHQPADLALAAGFLLFAFPVELSRVLRASRRATGRWSLAAVGPFRDNVPVRRFVPRALLLAVIAFALLLVTLPLTGALADGPLRFLPRFMTPGYDWTTLPQNRAWLLTVGALLVAVNGLLIPWVEEVYYRGYLLARTPGRRGTAVVVGAVLFAVEHLWQPQNWPLIAALAILLGGAVYRWRTLWIGYAVHAFANSFGILVLIAGLLRH